MMNMANFSAQFPHCDTFTSFEVWVIQIHWCIACATSKSRSISEHWHFRQWSCLFDGPVCFEVPSLFLSSLNKRLHLRIYKLFFGDTFWQKTHYGFITDTEAVSQMIFLNAVCQVTAQLHLKSLFTTNTADVNIVQMHAEKCHTYTRCTENTHCCCSGHGHKLNRDHLSPNKNFPHGLLSQWNWFKHETIGFHMRLQTRFFRNNIIFVYRCDFSHMAAVLWPLHFLSC